MWTRQEARWERPRTCPPTSCPSGWTDGAADYDTWFAPVTRRFAADAVRLLGLDERLIRVAKHRCLKRVRQDVLEALPSGDLTFAYSEGLLTETWEMQRLSCPKRSTLGAFLLETLPPQWFDYVDFHLATVGCRFCRASFKDLKEQRDGPEQDEFRRRLMTSTVGFLSQP